MQLLTLIGNFPGMSWTDLWETHPTKIYDNLFSFAQIYWMSFPEIGLAHAPEIKISKING